VNYILKMHLDYLWRGGIIYHMHLDLIAMFPNLNEAGFIGFEVRVIIIRECSEQGFAGGGGIAEEARNLVDTIQNVLEQAEAGGHLA